MFRPTNESHIKKEKEKKIERERESKKKKNRRKKKEREKVYKSGKKGNKKKSFFILTQRPRTGCLLC